MLLTLRNDVGRVRRRRRRRRRRREHDLPLLLLRHQVLVERDVRVRGGGGDGGGVEEECPAAVGGDATLGGGEGAAAAAQAAATGAAVRTGKNKFENRHVQDDKRLLFIPYPAAEAFPLPVCLLFLLLFLSTTATASAAITRNSTRATSAPRMGRSLRTAAAEDPPPKPPPPPWSSVVVAASCFSAGYLEQKKTKTRSLQAQRIAINNLFQLSPIRDLLDKCHLITGGHENSLCCLLSWPSLIRICSGNGEG